MCLIVHRTLSESGKGSYVPNEVISYNKRLNPDGFGIAWRSTKGLRSERFAPKEFDAFHKLLKKIDKNPTVEYVAHFRRATHGDKCREMSHPFTYQDKKGQDVLIFHNGIIDISTEKGQSDTAAFVQNVLSLMTPRWWSSPHYKYLVEQAVGWSRLLVMTEEETIRLNDRKWSKHGGIWYSTDPFPPTSKVGTSYGSYSAGYIYGTQAGTGWRGDEDDDDDVDGSNLLMASESASLANSAKRMWMHMGHPITPISQEDSTDPNEVADQMGMATCDKCKTLGEYYVIEGKVYIDVVHQAASSTVIEEIKAMGKSASKAKVIVPGIPMQLPAVAGGTVKKPYEL